MTLQSGCDYSDAQINWRHTIALWLWIGWITFYLVILIIVPPIICYAAIYNDPTSKTFLFYFTTIMFLFMVIPCERKYQPKWALDIGGWIARHAVEYFKMKVLFEDEEALRKSSPSFFVLEPHDVLPLSIMAFNDTTGTIKGHKCLGCITSFCFMIPFMRHIYSWAQAVPATKEVINDALSRGISPCICPGGVQEAALITSNRAEINLFLKKRKGFVKIAISHGAPIVPVFCFGLRDSYSFWIANHPYLTWFGRKLGFMPMIFFGAHGIPFGPAKSVPYVNIVGIPIPCVKKKYEDISDAEVDKVHSQYLVAVEALFEKHKCNHGYDNVKLKIH